MKQKERAPLMTTAKLFISTNDTCVSGTSVATGGKVKKVFSSCTILAAICVDTKLNKNTRRFFPLIPIIFFSVLQQRRHLAFVGSRECINIKRFFMSGQQLLYLLFGSRPTTRFTVYFVGRFSFVSGL